MAFSSSPSSALPLSSVSPLECTGGVAGSQQGDLLARARAFAEPLIAAESLDSGENTLEHAQAVARILAGIGGSEVMQGANYLVDAWEHLTRPHEAIAKRFGRNLADLAQETTALVRLQRRTTSTARGEQSPTTATAHASAAQVESVRKMLLAFSRDLRVVMLRLASRLQTLRYYAASRRAPPPENPAEVLLVFAPLANGAYVASSPLDAISAYEHEFGRPKLIEKLSELLFVNEARPGDAHRSFASVPFDLVCTTNFDYILERQYELIPRHCTPLIDEDQLAVNLKDPGIALLKIHGDLNHPTRLVATETDYDRFLEKYPLLATFLANLLITRTAVLIGYSLDDPDFRQVGQVVGDRLGRSRRPAYAIAVGAKSTDVSRFERRGVRVINLASEKAQYSRVLADVFQELGDYWRSHVIPASQIKEEQSLRELSLPTEVNPSVLFCCAINITIVLS